LASFAVDQMFAVNPKVFCAILVRGLAVQGRLAVPVCGRCGRAMERRVMTPRAVAEIERLRHALAAGEPLPETKADEEVIAA
jgi:hypothetical protein